MLIKKPLKSKWKTLIIIILDETFIEISRKNLANKCTEEIMSEDLIEQIWSAANEAIRETRETSDHEGNYPLEIKEIIK